MDEPDVDAIAMNGGEMFAVVYTRRLDPAAAHAGFVEIKFCAVKSAEVVDHAHHEFQRIVRLEVQALVTLHGIAGRMPFSEGVTRETFDLKPHPVDDVLLVAPCPAVFKKTFLDPFELF